LASGDRRWARCVAAVLLAGGVSVAAAQAKPTIMTKDQAKELFRSVDEILQFASQDTGLPIVHPVKRTLISREQVSKYLTKKFDEDESAKRLQSSEIVLKKFGLLDRDFHLRPFLLSLLTEQVAGFYDEKTKTVNLLDYVAPEDQKPVLAHELTHALQDQKVHLETWADTGYTGVSKTASEDNKRLQVDELETAREAVTEGQAMVVFIDYTLKPAGKTLADVPDVGSKMQNMASSGDDSPVMARAPLLLQRSLTFPYADGLSFEQTLLLKGGKDLAFTGALDSPPGSTFEIMNPLAWLAHAPVPVLPLPDVHTLLDAEWAPYDVGVMGELDVQIMAELFGGRELASALAPQWAGGVYYAAQRRNATPAEKDQTGSLGLIYYSRWKNQDSARSFLRIYAGELARKYTHVARRKDDAMGDDEENYTTSEGDVLLSMTDSGVFISEGFPRETALHLRSAVLAVQANGPLRRASLPMHDPAVELHRAMSSTGFLKAAGAALR
jgi:hypothetical protein